MFSSAISRVRGKMDVVAADGRFHFVQGDFAVRLVRHRARVNGGDGRGPSLFVVEAVGEAAQDHFVAPAAVGHLANQVRHGATGDEKGGLLVQPLCRQFFQPVDRRVLPEDIVAHLGFRHGLAHRRGGPGHRVGSEFNMPHGVLLWPIVHPESAFVSHIHRRPARRHVSNLDCSSNLTVKTIFKRLSTKN